MENFPYDFLNSKIRQLNLFKSWRKSGQLLLTKL